MSDEKKFMTVDEMIAVLLRLSANGLGDYEVSCEEIMVSTGAPIVSRGSKLVEFFGKA